MSWPAFLGMVRRAGVGFLPSLNSCREIKLKHSEILAELWPN